MSSQRSLEDWSREEILNMLRERCSSGTPALALPIELGLPVVTLFDTVNESELVLATASESMETNFCSLCPCVVSFSYEGRTMAFMSHIVDWNHGTTPPRLSLEIPSRLLAMEHRQYFRIPLGESCGLHVSVSTHGGEPSLVRALDISIAGMLIEFSDDPDLPTEAKLEIVMRHGEDTVCVGAVVRHRRAGRYGLFFVDCVSERGVHPPESLRRLVANLEGRWLGRKRTAETPLPRPCPRPVK